jgi:hypothetical protein
MARVAILLLSLLGLSGCDPMSATFVAANMVTVIHGDKTLPDYVFSSQTKKNCSLLHAARNEEYCQDEPPSDTEALGDLADNRYCYRTLGGVDCYDRPDFLASGQTRVNFAAGGYLPDRRQPLPHDLRDTEGLAMAGIPPAPKLPAAPAAAPVAAPLTAAPMVPVTSESATAPAPKAAPKAKEPSTAKPAPEAVAVAPKPVPAPVNPPPPVLKASKTAELAQAPLMRAPRAQVAPLDNAPGQGTY